MNEHRRKLGEVRRALQRQVGELQETLQWAEKMLRECELRELIGVPKGITLVDPYVESHGGLDRHAMLEGQFGTLLEMRRTKCVVDFGKLGAYETYVSYVRPAA